MLTTTVEGLSFLSRLGSVVVTFTIHEGCSINRTYRLLDVLSVAMKKVGTTYNNAIVVRVADDLYQSSPVQFSDC